MIILGAVPTKQMYLGKGSFFAEFPPPFGTELSAFDCTHYGIMSARTGQNICNLLADVVCCEM